MRRVLAVSSSAGLLGAARSFDLAIRNVDRSQWSPLVVCPSLGPLVERLGQAGIPVEILCKDPDINETCLEGPAFRFSPRLLWRMAFRLKYMARIQRLARKMQADLVYLNTMKNVTSALAAKLAGRPVVWHVREVAADFAGVRKLRLWVLRIVADKVIVVSNSNRQMMTDLGVSPDRLVTVYNGVDLKYFTPPTQRDLNLATKLGIKPDETVIGMIGEWSRRKGAVQFLHAAHCLIRDHPNLKFIMVGGHSASEPEQAAAVSRLIKQLEIEPYVCAVGAQMDVRPYLGLMDIFVMPSLAEAFTRVNLEAMAIGKVIIATDVGGTSEGVIDGETGFIVPPGDPEAIANRVNILLDNPDQVQRMGQRGRKRAEKLFSAEDCTRQVQEVWLSVLE